MRSVSYIIFSLLLIAGCGSTEETHNTVLQAPAPIADRRDTVLPPRTEFETKIDTVNTTHQTLQNKDTTATSHQPRISYMIQIGAYKDPQNATRVQDIARERYHLPVINDYNQAVTLYQIRMGFFETREEAHTFCEQMKSEYANDYNDSWVIELRR